MDMPERLLVVIFQRGGADGLALMPPVADDRLHRLRPTLAQRPGHGLQVSPLFELHPRMQALGPCFHAGDLALIPACGSDDDTRSHFEAQDLMEHGARGVGSGWLGRFLRGSGGHPLQAVAMGDTLPLLLASAPGAMAYRSLQDAQLDPLCLQGLQRLYAADEALAGVAATAQQAAARWQGRSRAPYQPQHGAQYADTATAQSLRAVAELFCSGALPLRAACIDTFGWDSHFAQEALLGGAAEELASALAAFACDLGPRLRQVTVVVLSEFGRRVYENATLGTDHGRGGLMLVLGGGVRGGVHGAYPGLSGTELVGPGDLAVATDYRQVLLPVLARHGLVDAQTFPGWAGSGLDLFTPAPG
jgi:uncharacterized protein (DUF1501 family)